jgi:nucleotide-binding universal stress UspA family protein
VITLDGSELAEYALEPGLEVARSLGCEVTLLKVSRPVTLKSEDVARLESIEKGLGRNYRENLIAGDDSYLSDLATKNRSKVDRQIRFTAAEGPVAQAILAFAKQLDAHLIVMSTHGRTGLRRWVYGSITEKILRSANCAMLVVRPPLHELN